MKAGSLFGLLLITVSGGLLQGQESPDSRADLTRQEEALDYFDKWLREDVLYIITDEERAVFNRLATPEEKEKFIEEFWFRRDTDPRTAVNEFKEEHYRRIAYANERFVGGKPGWKSDRGRIYILHGPPTEIESHPAGGTYFRPLREGGGVTGVFPYERWRYRHIEGVGSDIILEFIDPTFTDEYRLALRPEEKDAFLNVAGGWTLAEEMGIAEKKDRPVFNQGDWSKYMGYPMMFQSARDMPFERYEAFNRVQQAPQLKHPELKELVNVNLTFESLPFAARADFFRLNDDQVLAPVSIELSHPHLSFKQDKGPHPTARLAIYGVVTSLGNRVVQEFDDEVVAVDKEDPQVAGGGKRSMYQKILTLDARGRYKLNLVIKDLNSGRVGVLQQALAPPTFGKESLELSSLILSDHIRVLNELPESDQMFVIGDLWVVPVLGRSFRSGGDLGAYFHVYGASVDQTSQRPALVPTYRLIHGGQILTEFTDADLVSMQFFSTRRSVFVQRVPTKDLTPGDYTLQIQLEDRVSGKIVALAEQFRIE